MKKNVNKKKQQSILGYYRRYGWKAVTNDLVHDLVGSFLYAMGVYYFASNADFAPGGITGVAMIIHHYVPSLGIGLVSLVINIPVALICYRLLGRVFFFKSVKSMLLTALFTDYIVPLLGVYPDAAANPLLAALFAGALYGMGLALIYIPGSSTGGTDFIIMSIRKLKPHLSIGTISIAVDGMLKRHLSTETVETLLRKELMSEAADGNRKLNLLDIIRGKKNG